MTTAYGTKGSPLRVGIAGAGLMGRWHAEASRRAGGRVVAVLDRDVRTAQRLASRHPGARGFADLTQMLQVGNLDVLHVCTPTSSHAAIAHAALAARVNVIVEKPFTLHPHEAERLFASAAEQGVLLCPTYQMAFQDGVRHAQRLLTHIGSVVHTEAQFYSGGGQGADPAVLDTIVAEILPHPLSLAQALLPGGLPNSTWTTIRPRVGELRALTDVGGMTLSISISMHARPTASTFTVVGSRGTIYLNLFHGYAFMVRGGVSRIRKITNPFTLATSQLFAATGNLGTRTIRRELAYPGLHRLVSIFYSAVRVRTAPPFSPREVLTIEWVRHRLLGAVERATTADG